MAVYVDATETRTRAAAQPPAATALEHRIELEHDGMSHNGMVMSHCNGEAGEAADHENRTQTSSVTLKATLRQEHHPHAACRGLFDPS